MKKSLSHLRYALLLMAFVITVAQTSACSRAEIGALRAETGLVTNKPAERMKIQRVWLDLSVENPSQTAETIRQHAASQGWDIDSDRVDERTIYSLTLRVPQAQLDDIIKDFKAFGNVTSYGRSVTDVTDLYRDEQTRLENLIALRDRLRELLARAESVQDVLAVETELNRIQTEIDQVQGWLTRTSDQVAMSELNLTIRQKRILGPLGWVFKGVTWGIGKLFVIK